MRIEIGDIYLAAYLELQGERLVEVRLRVAPYDVLRGVFVFEGERLVEHQETYARCKAVVNINQLIGRLATLRLKCLDCLATLSKEDPECPTYRIRNLDLMTREIRELPE